MSGDSDSIVAAIKGMTDAFLGRIQKTEGDFLEHSRRVESQMGQLVDLTKHMAVMNERNDSIHDDIVEIKTNLRTNQEKIEISIGRLHKRIDEVNTGAREHADLVRQAIESQIRSNQEKCDLELKGIRDRNEAELNLVRAKHSTLDESYKAYVNKIDGAKRLATGLWILFTFVVGTFGFIGKSWLESIDKEKHELIANVKRQESAHRELEELIRQRLK